MALQTSTNVGFGLEGRRLVMETESGSTVARAAGTSVVRVFPSYASAVVTAVMGTARKVATYLPEKVTEYVSFSGSDSASLRYPPTGAVTIESTKFFQSNPSVVYEAATGRLVLDAKAHGLVKISYTSFFDRYIVGHGDSPCRAARTQTVGGTDPETGTKYYDPAFLVAEADNFETTSLEVNGPACSSSAPSTNQYDDYKQIGILLEVDAVIQPGMYPTYFSAGNAPRGFNLNPQAVNVGGVGTLLYCGCKVRAYPRLQMSLQGVNCAVSSGPVDQGTKHVMEALTFSGAQSVNLKYPLSGSLALHAVSANAVDIFGNEIEIDFIGPGGWVNEVEWVDANTYQLTVGSRTVRENEVVAVTRNGRNTIPCYTFCQASYTSEYNTYDMLFTWEDAKQWYGSAMVLASDGSKLGHLNIEPPSKGGVL